MHIIIRTLKLSSRVTLFFMLISLMIIANLFQQNKYVIMPVIIIMGTIGLILLIGSVTGYIRVISKIRTMMKSEEPEDNSLI